MQNMTVLLATENKGKMREFARIVESLEPHYGWTILSSSDLGLKGVEETGTTFMDNAILKALNASSVTDHVTLGEDSGLEVDALQGAPGVNSHRFSFTGKDEDNNELLLQKLRDVGEEARGARYRCALAVAHKGEVVLKAEGFLEGRITTEPFGEGGFGYDPIFYCPFIGKTLGNATDDEKDGVSHRRKAIEKVLPELVRFLKGVQVG